MTLLRIFVGRNFVTVNWLLTRPSGVRYFLHMQITTSWDDGKIVAEISSVIEEGSEVQERMAASPEVWLEVAVGVLAMLPGKPSSTGDGYVLGPANSDPDMIGALIAQYLKEDLGAE